MKTKRNFTKGLIKMSKNSHILIRIIDTPPKKKRKKKKKKRKQTLERMQEKKLTKHF